MIINSILIYLILNCIYFYHLRRSNGVGYNIWSDRQLINKKLIVISYLVVFFGFFRILKIFNENNIIDLKYIISFQLVVSMLIIFLLFFFFNRLIMMYVKLSVFGLHYYYLRNSRFKYEDFYILYIWCNCVRYFIYFRVINFCMTLYLIYLFGYDIFVNNMVLDQSIWFLKYYGLFKFVFLCIRFIAVKQDVLLDTYASYWSHFGDPNSKFWQNLTPELEEELDKRENKYRFGVIAK